MLGIVERETKISMQIRHGTPRASEMTQNKWKEAVMTSTKTVFIHS